MKRLLLCLIAVMLLALPAAAISCPYNLVQKDTATWTELEECGFGKFYVSTDHALFMYEGFSLAPDTGYTPIYYPDPWENGSTQFIALRSGTADETGYLRLSPPEETIIPIKRASFDKIREELGWEASTDLQTRLERTYEALVGQKRGEA